MPDLALIAQALDFIESNLKEPIGVADMAVAAGYSLYHFSRTFNQATHHTPYDYLMRRRLSEAARVLLQTDERIIDVALDYQFNNPETFSRAFKRMFETQPSQSRREGHMDSRWLMPRLTLAHLEQIAKGPYLRPVLERRDAFQVVGLTTLVKGDRSVLPDLWDLLHQELASCAEPVGTGDCYGFAWYPEGWEGRGYLYMAAVEIQGGDTGNAALVTKAIPAMTCARFIHKGPRRGLPLTLHYIYHTWLPKSGRSPSHPLIVECYGRDFGAADGDESEIGVYVPLEA
jgi:AraC family transcriptional regulator